MDRKWQIIGNSLVVQWLGLSALTAKGPGSILQDAKKKKKGILPNSKAALCLQHIIY